MALLLFLVGLLAPTVDSFAYQAWDIGACFDRTGWCGPYNNGILTGLYRSSCSWLYCIENTRGMAMPTYNCEMGNWGLSFDRAGWSTCPNRKYMTAMYRSGDIRGGSYLYNLEYAMCCGTRPNDVPKYCYSANWWGCFDHAQWCDCGTGYALSGLWRNTCEQIWCIEEAWCCRITCPDGYATSGNDCTKCPAYTYTALDGNGVSTCRGCPAGQTLSGTTCASCKPGTYNPISQSYCRACPTGKYALGYGWSTCNAHTACVKGYYATNIPSSTANRACKVCPSGTYSTGVNVGSCTAWTNCKAGYYAKGGTSTNNHACYVCPSGTYSGMYTHVNSCSALTTCLAGSYAVGGTTTEDRKCHACAGGTFTASPNQARCQAWRICPSGSFVSGIPSPAADRVCSACPLGTYASETNAAKCLAWSKCGPGFYATNTPNEKTNRVCEGCPDFTYSKVGNAPSCTAWTNCKPGYYASGGSFVTDRACPACPAFTYSTTSNAKSCTAWTTCAAGFYAVGGTSTTNRACPACAAETFSTTTNAESCTGWQSCGTSYFAKAGSSIKNRECVACPPGTENFNKNAASCAAAPTAKYLALTIPAGSAWGYADAIWTTPWSSNFDSGKTNAFNFKCNRISIAIDGYGTATFTHNKNMALHDIFASNVYLPSGVGVETVWRTLGPAYAWQNYCNTQGINVNVVGASFARFGIVMNQENDCLSPDTSIGIGLTHRAVLLGAGSGCNCCQNGGSCATTRNLARVYVDGCLVDCPLPSVFPANVEGVTCAVNAKLPHGTTCTVQCKSKYYTSSGTSTYGCTGAALVPPTLVCTAWRTCAAGSYQTVAPSATVNRACAACASGFYSTTTNAASCISWRTCDAGYDATGGSAIADRTCVRRSCGKPSFTEYSFAAGGALFQDQRTYSCAQGYEGIGANSKTTQCLPSGTSMAWTTPSGCTRIKCAAPNFGVAYTVAGGIGDYSETRSVTCAVGYKGTAGTVKCTGTWQATVAYSCTQITCPNPPAPAGHLVGSGGLIYMNRRVITCDRDNGYEGSPIDIYCRGTGQWDVPQGCSFVSCPGPVYDTAVYALAGSPTFPQVYDSTVSYSCKNGYSGAGGVITCQASKTWTAMAACTKKTCSATLPTDVGYTYSGAASAYLDTRAYSCASGFKPQPFAGTIQCQVTGANAMYWTTPTGCSRTTCPGTTPPTGHLHATTVGSFEDTRAVTCSSGWAGSPASLTCQAPPAGQIVGAWTTATGCAREQCPTSLPRDASFRVAAGTVYDFETTRAVTCNSGYENAPNPSITCVYNAGTGKVEWQVPSNCPKVWCPAMTVPAGFVIDSATAEYQTARSGTCATGYSGIAFSVACQANKVWQPLASQCTIKDCGAPVAKTANGYTIAGGITTYGATRVVSCLAGFSGTPPTLTCQADASWSAQSGCVRQSCSAPETQFSTLQNTQYNFAAGQSTFEATRAVSCDTGYEQSAGVPAAIVCQSFLLWTTPAGCRKVTCAAPVQIQSGHKIDLTAGGDLYEQGRPVSCIDGYVGTPADVICQADRTFTTPTGCSRKSCGAPLLPTGYTIASTAIGLFEDTRVVGCAVGWVGTPAVLTCQSSGAWSVFANCERITCTPPPPSVGYVIPAGGSKFEDTRQPSCATGYEALGTIATIQCLSGKTWSAPRANDCTIKHCLKPVAATGYVLPSEAADEEWTYLETRKPLCAAGWQGSASTIVCQADKTWTAQTGCSRMDCGAPVQQYWLSAAKYTFSGGTSTVFELGTRTLSCKTGFEGSPAAIQCIVNGDGSVSWSTITGCNPVSCGEPAVETGYSITLDATHRLFLHERQPTCATGYEVSDATAGVTAISCQADKTWTARGGCQRRSCGDPIIQDGYVVVPNKGLQLYGDLQTPTCLAGFAGTAAAITCQADETWTAYSGCTIMSCGEPAAVDGYVFPAGGALFRATRQPTCATGFETISSVGKINCVVTGKVVAWTAATGCQRVSCGVPAVDDGYVIAANTVDVFFRDTRAPTCLAGFEGTPVTITCQYNRLWSAQSGCERITCPTPVALDGYALAAGTSRFRDTRVVTCISGFEHLTAVPVLTCQANKQWSAQLNCQRVFCNEPAVEDGYVIAPETGADKLQHFRDQRQPTCLDGFEQTNPDAALPKITCQADETWSARSGCELQDCKAPAVVYGYAIPAGGTLFRSERQPTCIPGFEAKTKVDKISCVVPEPGANVQWTPQGGCTRMVCGEPAWKDGYVVAADATKLVFEDVRQPVCEPGWEPEGEGSVAQIQCVVNEDGSVSWTAQTGCKRMTCGEPPATVGYVVPVDAGAQVFEDTRDPTCAVGFEALDGIATIKCEVDDGTVAWTLMNGCTRVTCGEPAIPDGFVLAGTGVVFESTRAVTCAEGWEGDPAPPASMQCLSTRAWTALTGCKRKDCGQPAARTGFVIASGNTLFGDVRETSCVEGYDEPSGAMTCQADGTWSTPTGCALGFCAGDPSAQDGYVPQGSSNGGQILVGSVQAVTCAKGWFNSQSELRGVTASVTCEASGTARTWSAYSGCTIVHCEVPEFAVGFVSQINPGLLSEEQKRYGSVLNYACDEFLGFTSLGGQGGTIRCQESGKWSLASDCYLNNSTSIETFQSGAGMTTLSAHAIAVVFAALFALLRA